MAKDMHHKKAEHHMAKAEEHHKLAKEHMAKVKHADVKEDKKLIKKEVKKSCMK
jgi:hypothetical protein